MTALVKRRLLIIALAILFFSFGLCAPFEQTITAYCLVEPAHQWSLRHFGSGMIAAEWDVNLTGRDSESIYFQIDQPDISSVSLSPAISPGNIVKKDDCVATIQSVNGMNQLLIGEAAVEREVQRRVAMESGSRDEDIEVARRRVVRDSVEIAGYLPEYERLRELFESDLLSATEYDRASARLSELQSEYELSQARLHAAESGAHPEELKMQDAEIKRLSAEVEGYRESFGAGLDVLSPIDGIVSQKQDARSVVVIQSVDTVAVRVIFPESFAAYVKPGLGVNVYFPGHQEHDIPVILDEIGFYGGDTTATFGIGLVDNHTLQLSPGMHGTAELPVGKMTLVERIRNIMFNRQ